MNPRTPRYLRNATDPNRRRNFIALFIILVVFPAAVAFYLVMATLALAHP